MLVLMNISEKSQSVKLRHQTNDLILTETKLPNNLVPPLLIQSSPSLHSSLFAQNLLLHPLLGSLRSSSSIFPSVPSKPLFPSSTSLFLQFLLLHPLLLFLKSSSSIHFCSPISSCSLRYLSSIHISVSSNHPLLSISLFTDFYPQSTLLFSQIFLLHPPVCSLWSFSIQLSVPSDLPPPPTSLLPCQNCNYFTVTF